ncbi:hypothetical protein LPJ68_003431 [Coemansia sp. RSA 1086]|nr:hypothetical protein LPJ68_003431 [Coemansia sp. RSA 1086]
MTNSQFSSSVLFYLNGSRRVIDDVDLDMTLLQYLRSTGMTSVKLGCGEGGCGACTVMVSSYDTATNKPRHYAANACLFPLYAVDGLHIVTVEGLGTSSSPHQIQLRLASLHSFQCGFCTAGFVMSLYVLLRNNPQPSELEIEECFDGNLCRCTGYRPILDAAKTFAKDAWKSGSLIGPDGLVNVAQANGCGVKDCCQLQTNEFSLPEPAASRTNGAGCCRGGSAKLGCCKSATVNGAEAEKIEAMKQFRPYDETQEPIFPPFLARYARGETTDEHCRLALMIRNRRVDAQCKLFYRPLSLKQLLAIISEHPEAKIVAGSSEIGIEKTFKHSEFPVQVYVSDVPELRQVEEVAGGISFGANITLARFNSALQQLSEQHGLVKSQGFAALKNALKFFAGNQIRNVATLAGNIATASPISDLNPVLLATGAVLTLVSGSGAERQVPMSEFFLSYRRTALQPGEILRSVFVPFSRPYEIVRSFKQAKRKDDDIAIVTCGMRVRIDPKSRIVEETAFGFGGMAPTTILAKEPAAACKGKTWGDSAVLKQMMAACQQELQLPYTVPGGMAEYRTALTCSFILKFWAISCFHLGIDCEEAKFVAEMDLDAEERALVKGQQAYDSVTDRMVVGKGVAHLSALKHTTGEARYVDDMPPVGDELHMAMVPSARAHARIVSIDSSQALAAPGVVKVLTSSDIPAANVWNIFHDEEILPTNTVHHMAQPVALVIARTRKQAQAGARLVQVEYEDLPAILTVQDAIAKESWFPEVRQLKNGDVDAAFASADVVLSGESYSPVQEHFYLETMGAIAVPKNEDGEIDLYASTQNPTEAQMVCAEVLGVPAARIVCHVKRMGGGFGGKESRSSLIAAFAALGAHHTKQSVRLMLDRDMDMMISGQRGSFLGRWTCAATRDGRLLGMRMHLFANGGFSHDLSLGVLDRAMSHVDNCFRFPATEIIGRICQTNTQSVTAFRGFGGPESMIICMSMLSELAQHLDMPFEQLQRINLYEPNDVTPFSQKLEGQDWNVPRMWDELSAEVQYDKLRREVDEFNACSRYRKRGLAIIPTKFGISFGVKHLNQGMALVHVYMDGSVLVAHGGTEMGQGLHTKMAQIAAETLQLPLSTIFISETATNTAANTSPTAASASSDLNGFAVYNACKKLADRLRPYREQMPNEPFSKIAKTAYLDRCDLSATGHYATPDIGFDWQTQQGQLFFYFTQGCAVAMVELDLLTGTHTALRTDIKMDVGRSLNKAIDIGQIEGAFTQGYGMYAMEEYLYSPKDGRLLTAGPGNYKIPSALDCPRELNISLLEPKEPNGLKTIFSSKGIGEPPLFLGASVYFALKDAVLAARKQMNVKQLLRLECPATPEVLRLACEDEIVEMTRVPKEQKQGMPFAVRI